MSTLSEEREFLGGRGLSPRYVAYEIDEFIKKRDLWLLILRLLVWDFRLLMLRMALRNLEKNYF